MFIFPSLRTQTVLMSEQIIATGQKPLSEPLLSLDPANPSTLVNPSGWVRVLPTFQLQDPRFPNVFAVGDVADSGAHKAARPGMSQALTVAENIRRLHASKGEELLDYKPGPAAIHLSLGFVSML
jgi:apoptosis-inducing factor 2